MRDYLKLIDTSTKGPRYDVTPLYADTEVFSSLLDDLLTACEGIEFDCIGAIDALGLILGAGLAIRAAKPLVPIRKGGKLLLDVKSVQFSDYSVEQKSLEMRRDAIGPTSRLLLVDDWIETGAQVNAAIKLVERMGAEVVAILTINCNDNEATRKIREDYRLIALTKDL
jgi:adenine phosphoribosyltransferase